MLHDASAELDCDLTGIGKIRRFWTWGSSYPIIIIGINILVLNMIMAIIIIMVITIITWGSSYRLGIHPLLQFSAQSWPAASVARTHKASQFRCHNHDSNSKSLCR